MIKTFGIHAFLLVALSFTSVTHGAVESSPNILLIVVDDLGYSDLSAMGGEVVKTPNMDSLLNEGSVFTSGYVTAPICGPSRVGILTGRYQDRIGFSTNHGPKIPTNYGLPKDTILLPQVLKEHGYRTGMVGKWHLGFEKYQTPNAVGFDSFYGFLHGFHSNVPGKNTPGPIYDNNLETSATKYLSAQFADKAVSFINKSGKDPFFLYLPFNAVHTPYEASPESLQKFSHIKNQNKRRFAAVLSELDEAVGIVLRGLKDSGKEDNTLIFFLSDNGGAKGPGIENNGELRSGKGTLYEGGIRVPFFVKWKGKIPQGSRINNPVISLDIFPTVLSAINVETSRSLEGKNLLPLLFEKTVKVDETSRSFFWKNVTEFDQKAVRKGNWKWIEKSPEEPEELYNLSEDIREKNNLAKTHPKIVVELKEEWERWNKENIEPLWMDSRIIRKP